MLHLFPFSRLIQGLFVATVLLSAAVSWLGGDAEGHVLPRALQILRLAPLIPFLFVFAVYGAWRYIKPLQKWTFPYIGGTWSGSLEYTMINGRKGSKSARLEIKQGLLRMRLKLETDESVSRTLAVVPEREGDFGEFRLYYVYVVERKTGVGAERVYRGTAIMHVSTAGAVKLTGDYFTEHKSTGSVVFQRDLSPPG
jgi:hypothetical protein